ncbi:hypothetical protein AAY473_001052 [Plecturocebus cupreus]
MPTSASLSHPVSPLLLPSPLGQEFKTSLANMGKTHLYKNTKISWVWWRMPLVPATQEAEAEESLEPRRWRLQLSPASMETTHQKDESVFSDARRLRPQNRSLPVFEHRGAPLLPGTCPRRFPRVCSAPCSERAAPAGWNPAPSGLRFRA